MADRRRQAGDMQQRLHIRLCHRVGPEMPDIAAPVQQGFQLRGKRVVKDGRVGQNSIPACAFTPER